MGKVAPSEQTHRDPTQGDKGSVGYTALAIALFVLVTWIQFRPILDAGLGQNVPLWGIVARKAAPGWLGVTSSDAIYETWLVSRNARAFLSQPLDFFESPHCAPFARSVTLGIPMTAMGVLAIPFVIFSDNPVLVYNAVLATMMLLACLGMFLLVREWTGVPAAAIVAGLLYGLSPRRLESIMHPSVVDEIWTVFAIYFAYRWLVHGRWRDALGLTASFALQATESFYPFLAAVVGVPPILAWMLYSQGVGKIRPLQIFVVAGVSAAVLYWMYEPYLATRSAGMWSDRTGIQVFAPLTAYFPGGIVFPGVAVAVGALIGLLLGRRGLAPWFRGDPRLALVVSALLVAWVAAGRFAPVQLGPWFPDLYAAMGSIVPGLDSIRVVVRLVVGVQLALVILAGLGASALVRLAGKQSVVVGLLLIGLTGVDLLRPSLLGLTRDFDWEPHAVEPDREAIAFFAELERRGNQGPVFELPFDDGTAVLLGPTRIFSTYYHGRKTSACFGSFSPNSRKRLATLSQKLPEPKALDELASLGFTTIVAHHSAQQKRGWRKRFARHRRSSEQRLEYLHGTDFQSAWAIDPAPQENHRDAP